MTEPGPDVEEGAEREGDDYDLMTYGEAAARLVELLAEERARLGELLAADPVDDGAVQRLRDRIALLESSAARYRQQSLSAEAFTQRFGFAPYSPKD